MVKKKGLIFSIVLLLILMASGVSSESICATDYIDKQVTVVNELPYVTLYCNNSNAESVSKAEVDGYRAKVVSEGIYNDCIDGINYYMLVDISTSIRKGEFNKIKSSLETFCTECIDENDNVQIFAVGNEVKSSGELWMGNSDGLINEIKRLRCKDDNSNIYDAISFVADEIQVNYGDENVPKRSVVLMFTDGVEDSGGGKTQLENAADSLNEKGIPLYAFAVGNSTNGKDNLRKIADGLSGMVYVDDIYGNMISMDSTLKSAYTITLKANNAMDIGEKFDVQLWLDGKDTVVTKHNVTAHRSGDVSNSIRYTINKIIISYWWLILILAIAIIVAIVMLIIRKHKGIVKIDDQIVYNDSLIERKRVNVGSGSIESKQIQMRINIGRSKDVFENINISGSIIVGRMQTCDVVIDDKTIARQNFCIEIQNGSLFLSDLNSTNGTFLNGVRVNNKTIINRGDTITAGQSRFTVDWE